MVGRQVNDLSFRIGITVQPTFVSLNLEQVEKTKECTRQSFISNAWLINFHDTCATLIVLATLPNVFTNLFSNTRTQWLANNFWRPMGAYVIWMKINFGCFAKAVQSLNALCARCSLSKNAIHASTQWQILSVQNSLLKNILTPIFALAFNQVLSFSVVLNI